MSGLQAYLQSAGAKPYAQFVTGLSAFGSEVELTAGLAVAELLEPLWADASPEDMSPSKTLTHLRAYAANPTPELREALGSHRYDAYYQDTNATLAAGAVTHLATAVFYGDEPFASCAVIAGQVLGEAPCRAAILRALGD